MNKGSSPMKRNTTGELRVRQVPAELIRKLKIEAVESGTTLNSLLIEALNYYVWR